MFKIAQDEHTLQNGEIKHGYLINGKMRKYLLEIDNNDIENGRHGVYEYPTGKYFCIVDKSTSQVGMDRIVNRIFALHNDSLLASQITTL